MKLDRFAFVLRQRKPWESLDLGVSLAGHWRSAIYSAWFLTYGPYAILMGLLLGSHPVVAFFGLWWAKPAFDRVLLFVFSRAVFDEAPQWRQSLRAFRGLLGSSRLWGDLTYLRLSPFRGFTLPVVQLEGQYGAARRQRVQTLGRDTAGYAAWLAVSCFVFVVLVAAVVGLLFWAAIPVNSDGADTNFLRDTPALMTKAMFFCAIVIGDSVIEPIYVAGCFALYLNRRSDLEGWDLELALKRLGERLRIPQATAVVVLACSLAAAMLLGGACDPARAAQPDSVAPKAQPVTPAPESAPVQNAPTALIAPPIAAAPDPKTVARDVLKDPAFGEEEHGTTWRYISPPDEPSDGKGWFSKLLLKIANFFSRIADSIAWASRILVYVAWGIGIVGVAALLFYYRAALIPQRKSKWRAPSMLFGMDVRAQSLPDDVADIARKLIAEGKTAAALSLLYRATLVTLIHRERIEFAPGDTESGCERRVEGKITTAAACYFSELLATWRETVYAHRSVSREVLDSLCERWPSLFRMAARSNVRASR